MEGSNRLVATGGTGDYSSYDAGGGAGGAVALYYGGTISGASRLVTAGTGCAGAVDGNSLASALSTLPKAMPDAPRTVLASLAADGIEVQWTRPSSGEGSADAGGTVSSIWGYEVQHVQSGRSLAVLRDDARVVGRIFGTNRGNSTESAGTEELPRSVEFRWGTALPFDGESDSPL